MGSELKPCPFCGGESVLSGGGDAPSDEFYVECATRACFALGPSNAQRDKAIAAWNTRRPDAPAPEGVSRDPVKEMLAEALRQQRAINHQRETNGARTEHTHLQTEVEKILAAYDKERGE